MGKTVTLDESCKDKLNSKCPKDKTFSEFIENMFDEVYG